MNKNEYLSRFQWMIEVKRIVTYKFTKYIIYIYIMYIYVYIYILWYNIYEYTVDNKQTLNLTIPNPVKINN